MQASGARRAPVIRPECGASPTKLSFGRGATCRAILHYSRRTVALASAALPTARRARKHGARRGAHGARPARRRDGPPRLRLVAADALPWPQPAGARRLPRGAARRARRRRRPPAHRRARAPAPPRDHLQRDRALRRRRVPCSRNTAGSTPCCAARSASLGVPVVAAAPAARAAAPSAAPCFAEPARGELTLRGRKLVGSAQWRERGAMLQHGSILVDDDQSSIADFLRETVAPSPPPATLRDALGRAPVMAEVGDALCSRRARARRSGRHAHRDRR